MGKSLCLSRNRNLQNQKNRELSPDSFQFRLPGLGESSSISSFGFKAEIAVCRFYDCVCVCVSVSLRAAGVGERGCRWPKPLLRSGANL